MTDVRPPTADRALRRLAGWAAGTTYLLIVMGAVVRVSGSGLGCPDWPTCWGRWIPPLDRSAIIEYSHRSVAALVGVMTVAVALVAICTARDARRWIGVGLVGLVGVQAWLGRVVVLTELVPTFVSIHLVAAMLVFAGFIVLSAPPARKSRDSTRAWLLASLVLALVVVGGLVRGANAGMAFPDWPLMDGALIPSVAGQPLRQLHLLHRLLALGVLTVLVGAMVGTRWDDSGRRQAVVRALMVAVATAMLGAANVWLRMPPVVAVAHLAGATASFGFTVWAAVRPPTPTHGGP